MNVLFIMLSASSFEYESDGSMLYNLTKMFKSKGHNVFPVAPAIDKIGLIKEGEFNVVRVNTLKLFNVSPVRKGLANLLLSKQYKDAILKYYKDISIDLIIVPTPTVLFADVTSFLKDKYNASVYLMLRDIFPQNAVDLNMIRKNSFIWKFFRNKERKLYRTADKIGCTSQGNIDYIINNNDNISIDKLHILNNFQLKSNRIKADENIVNRYNIKAKFVIIFGGNFGKPQKIENVIDFAKQCERYPDVKFILIGQGTHRYKAEKIAKERNVLNISFYDRIPRNDYKSLLQFCNVGLISLNEKFTVPNTPFKLCDYFDAGIPVLASIDKGTDLGEILMSTNTGRYALTGEMDQLMEQFDYLYRNSEIRKEMGRNGQLFYDQNMTIEIAYDTIISKITEITC